MSKVSDGLAGLRKRPVFVEQYGVYVKPLTVGQREAFAAWRKDNDGSAKVVSLLLSMSVCDADGAILLDSPDGAADLDAALADALCLVIAELNGLTEKRDPKADSSDTPEPPSSVG